MKNIFGGILQTFKPLRNPNMSIFLGGHTISMLGVAMQMTAQTWVIWNLSGSTSILGFTVMLNFIPMLLFGAFSGVIADRFNRRKLLIVIQFSKMALAFIFATLVQMNIIEIWHIYLLAFALGCVATLDMPAQTAFVGDLAGAEESRAAITLNNMVRQLSRSVGPALAGVAMGNLGIEMTFWLNGSSFIVTIGALLILKGYDVTQKAKDKRRGNIKEAKDTILKSPRIQDLLIFSACVPFFAISAIGIIPAIVTDYLQEGPETLGWIQGASGAGALFGSIVLLPSVQKIKKIGKLLSFSVVWIGLWYILIANSITPWVWVVGVFIGNSFAPVVLTTSVSLIQILSPDAIQGRLLGIWMMISFGTQPFGALLIGFVGEWVGAPNAILVYGLLMVIIALSMLLLRKGLYKWKPEEIIRNSAR